MASLHSNQQGFSILTVMIAAGLGAIVLAGISKMMSNQFRSQESIKLRADIEYVRQFLHNATSCTDTLAASCVADSLLAVKRNSSTDLIPASGRQMGKHYLRAICNSTGDGVIVEGVRLKSTTADPLNPQPSDYLPDPLTGKIVRYGEEAANIFGGGIELCSLSGGGGSSPAPLVTGAYEGDTLLPTGTQTISVGFRPEAVQIYGITTLERPLVFVKFDGMQPPGFLTILDDWFAWAMRAGDSNIVAEGVVRITNDGFRVRGANANRRNAQYYYIAYR